MLHQYNLGIEAALLGQALDERQCGAWQDGWEDATHSMATGQATSLVGASLQTRLIFAVECVMEQYEDQAADLLGVCADVAQRQGLRASQVISATHYYA